MAMSLEKERDIKLQVLTRFLVAHSWASVSNLIVLSYF